MAQRKRGPVKGTPAWNKKVMGNRQDEMRVNKLSKSLFDSAKTTDSIFAGGKSQFYPEKEKTMDTVKRVAKKASNAMKNYATKRRQQQTAKR